MFKNKMYKNKLQNARHSSPSLCPEVCSNSCPLSPWCHPNISSWHQSFLVSGSFPMSQLFTYILVKNKQTNKKLKKELQYGPGIQLLDMYLEKIIIWKDTGNPILITALFTITKKTWKQPTCPLTGEWIKKQWYTCKILRYENEVILFATTWMSIKLIILSEVIQRKTNIIWLRLLVDSKKKDTIFYTYLQNLFTELK